MIKEHFENNQTQKYYLVGCLLYTKLLEETFLQIAFGVL